LAHIYPLSMVAQIPFIIIFFSAMTRLRFRQNAPVAACKLHYAWERQRNVAGARVKWMFTADKARAKMGRAYLVTPKESSTLWRDTSWVWSCARSPAVDARDPPPASLLGPGPARRAASPPSATAPPAGDDAAPAVPVGKVVGIGRDAFSGNMRVSFQAASHGLRSGRGRFVRALCAEPGRSHPYPDSLVCRAGSGRRQAGRRACTWMRSRMKP
jgi:hypothetical protein